jgi:two-component system NtrC family response regulator
MLDYWGVAPQISAPKGLSICDMAHGRILLVEDDETLRRATGVLLEKAGYETSVAIDVLQATDILKTSPQDLVITDLTLPGASGLELVKTIHNEYPETMVVVITAYATVETAVEAMKCGAYDYLPKPVLPHDLRTLVNRALERTAMLDEIRTLRSSIDRKFGFENIIGNSPTLLHVLDTARRVAHTDATVLIRGETGTGKEILAKAIHFNSSRRNRPFVVINCGAIPHDLLESDLFGHVRGAFTGALTHKTGKVESADGGTVFFDEIGEMPLDLQVRLLRLLQEREIEKVGSTVPTRVDVRIIAATHRNLTAMVAQGSFREDLYYRLNVVPIEVPPLRARIDDIPEFVVQFFNESKKRNNRPELRMSQSHLKWFSEYRWPGNVRELQNAVERMVVLCPGSEITEADIPDFLRRGTAVVESSPEEAVDLETDATLASVERALIIRTLRAVNWNQSQAAKRLGITRKILMCRIAKFGIERENS